MGIDKMNKEAVYDSLIDASKIISEEGADLKGALKSGTLQSKIIGAISGQLDKSKGLKRQIDAAVLKGEIEKDINKEKNQLDAEYKKLAIKKLEEEIGPGGLKQDIISIYGKQGVVPKGNQLAALARNRGINITGVEDEKIVEYFADHLWQVFLVRFLRDVSYHYDGKLLYLLYLIVSHQ